jgi:hypothetical protein
MLDFALGCGIAFAAAIAIGAGWMLRAVRPRSSPLHRER